jgi:hypothetical protein
LQHDESSGSEHEGSITGIDDTSRTVGACISGRHCVLKN